MVTIMANRSSLEMMLDKIQQLEDQPKDELPPALPVRPSSRGRLPRAKKPQLLGLNGGAIRENRKYTLNQQTVAGETNAGVPISAHSQIKQSDISDEVVEKAVANIQKSFRGHQARCSYQDLRSRMVVLQSIARGENARKEYRFRRKRLGAIIVIQKNVRTYIECRRLQSSTQIYEQDKDVKVPYSSVIELHKQVLRTEAKVRAKKWENEDLKIQLQEMDKKWMQHEERMKSMEREWQDQFTYIQKCLAAGKKNSGPIITFAQYDTIEEHYNQNVDDNVKGSPERESLDLVNKQSDCEDENTKRLHPGEELRKLKVKFKTWKKEYRNKLREAQVTFKKLGNAEIVGRSQRNNWWERFTH